MKEETQITLRPQEVRHDILNINADETLKKLAAIGQFQAIVRRELKEGLDYGVIPGTQKPTLLKPGAEKLAKLLDCFDEYEIIERIEDWDKPLFRYLVRCTLYLYGTGIKISSGLGECNSMEFKYRFRWLAEDQIPIHVDKSTLKTKGGKQTIFEFDFALEKRETTGKYGKSKEYWDRFDKAIQNGITRHVQKNTKSGKNMFGQEYDTDLTLYQVPNPDIFDQVNTLVKMAKKRALVDAALSAGRLSDLFTQDLEDMAETIIEPMKSTPAEPEAKKEEPKPDSKAESIAGNADCTQAQITEIDRMASSLVDKFGLAPDSIMAETSKRLGIPIAEEGGFDYAFISENQADEILKFLNKTMAFQEKKAKGAKK
jgi:hypothetical protein